MHTYRRILQFAVLSSLVLGFGATGSTSTTSHPNQESSVTILCYLNGDNDLSQEVLHALDMMETVGSSAKVNVIALVDGHQQWLQPYGKQWAQTRLLRLETDPQIGVINSTILEEWGEASLGSPEILARFIQAALTRYPAQRYLFYAFAHSQGVIDTRRLTPHRMGKTLSISPDTTNQTQMSLGQFHDAIKAGLDGRTFDLMVLFSCLANMVEVGYAFSDVTRYLVGSEDEIHLLNQPAGSYQIRGLPFEQVLAALHANPGASARELGKKMVDTHVESYNKDVTFTSEDGVSHVCRFSAGMALVDCSAMPPLVEQISDMTRLLIAHSENPAVARAMGGALSATRQFASFLNLEYYDFQRFLENLRNQVQQPALRQACDAVLDILVERVLLYERHTSDCDATGMSIYLSNPLVPDNIFQTHQAMYAQTRFSRATQWGAMIQRYRQQFKASARKAKPSAPQEK